MSKKVYVFVGNWGFAPAPKGITTFQYDMQTGELKFIETVHPEIAAGQLCLDEERMVLYAVNECGERRNEIGGGGYVLSFFIDPETGRLKLLNERNSLSPEPSYLCMSRDRNYLMTCHCSDPWHVTKIIRKEDGSFGNEVLFDDTSLVLFPILEDGRLGAPCDVMLTEGTGGKGEHSQRNVDPVTNHIQLVEVISRLHAVIRAPQKNFFITCDKGMDKLITFRIDEEKGKFEKLDEYSVEEVASFPRYGVFHPTLPVFYANNENLAILNCFAYGENGKLQLLEKIPLISEEIGLIEGKPVGAQDILVDPAGKTLYVTLCGLNAIVVLHLDEKGRPEVKQFINSRGTLPRGICLSPDGRFLLSGNMVSGDITIFEVQEEGRLIYTGKKFEAVSPSAIRMLVINDDSQENHE